MSEQQRRAVREATIEALEKQISQLQARQNILTSYMQAQKSSIAAELKRQLPLPGFEGMQASDINKKVRSELRELGRELKTNQSEIDRQAGRWTVLMTDPQTGAGNEDFLNHARRLVATQARQGVHSHAAVVVIDLNHFGLINKAIGQHKGDEAIKLAAEALRDLRPTDFVSIHKDDEAKVSRSSKAGDEFYLVLPNTTQEQAEKIMAERIQPAFRRLAREFREHPQLRENPVDMAFGVHHIQFDSFDPRIHDPHAYADGIIRQLTRGQIQADRKMKLNKAKLKGIMK